MNRRPTRYDTDEPQKWRPAGVRKQRHQLPTQRVITVVDEAPPRTNPDGGEDKENVHQMHVGFAGPESDPKATVQRRAVVWVALVQFAFLAA